MYVVLPSAFVGGSFILLAFIIVMCFAVVYGFFTFFTKRGSGINLRSWKAGSDGGSAPGAAGAEEASGKDEGDGSGLRTHGTK